MKNPYSLFLSAALLLCLGTLAACDEKEEPEPDALETGVVWRRYGSPNGYQTDLALGGIAGEAANRVYMCEFGGSPTSGLYKGTLTGNKIRWDAQYGLPEAELTVVGGSEATLYFGVGNRADAGKYRKGSWSGTCGALSAATGTGGTGTGGTGGTGTGGTGTGGTGTGGTGTGGTGTGGTGTGGTGTGPTGTLNFWSDMALSAGNGGAVTVTVGGSSQTFSSSLGSAPTQCGAAGAVHFINLTPGTQAYSARNGRYAWSGTATVTANLCLNVRLNASNGADGAGNTGRATFWNSSDQGCGPITVTVGGQTGTISSYYSSGTPSCGATGCANFTLAPAVYAYTARCSRYSWTGQLTVTSGGCSTMLLN